MKVKLRNKERSNLLALLLLTQTKCSIESISMTKKRDWQYQVLRNGYKAKCKNKIADKSCQFKSQEKLLESIYSQCNQCNKK